MEYDPKLGREVSEHLQGLGIETPMTGEPNSLPFVEIKAHHTHIMISLGLDLNDDSLKDTPKRVAKMYCEEIFTGLNYDYFPKATTIENHMAYDEMVLVRNIEVNSMCEHHFLPFVGTASIAYIPKQKIIGLSKFNRIVDFFARRPQVQERLTEQVCAALQFILDTDDVAVVFSAKHFCVRLRGVKDTCSDTVTSKMCGRFRVNEALRLEFLSLNQH